jgi:amino acid adenylation domain-containing protein
LTRLLHELLRASAEERPKAPAVEDGERVISYGELDDRSGQLADLLVERGVARGDRVGLYLDKSLEAVVGIYGILKAGAAYVPFDPQAPLSRLAYIADNAGIRCLVSSTRKAASWPELVHEGAPVETVVQLDAGDAPGAGHGPEVLTVAELEERSPVPPDRGLGPADLAYVLYTSGSTGTPKGVMLSHHNSFSFVDWATKELGIGPSDRLSSHAPLHFDLSVLDLYCAAQGGSTVVLVPGELSPFPVELARFIQRTQLTTWYSVPSVLSMLTLRGNLASVDLPHLRNVVFAGEVFPTKYLYRLMELVPKARFVNLYGPTETNACTWYEVPRDAEQPESIPIGRAIADTEVFAVDEEGERVEPGEVGELLVRGPTVMQGYLGDVERTAQSLVVEDEADPAARVYRTGDLVREDENGDFLFLGRRDSQVKSRGYRIELGDVEAALYAHPSVVECAVVAVPDDVFTNTLAAHVVVRDDTDASNLAHFCEGRLPRYMIPDSFEFRDALPKSSTGKILRTALEPSPTTSA